MYEILNFEMFFLMLRSRRPPRERTSRFKDINSLEMTDRSNWDIRGKGQSLEPEDMKYYMDLTH